jgi:superfamily I DNA and RNA helicase
MPDKNMGDLLYSFASLIEQTIPINIGWQVNTAYSTKQTKENHLFLTNTNNVKGLEFPFVICISRKITDSYTYRNSMYMATTRSFLKTFLVIDEQENSQENLKPIIDGLHQINNTGKIITKEPSTSEKDQIRMQLEKTSKDKNLQDFIISVYDELSIPNGVRRIINDLLKSLIQNGIKDRITIRSFIEQNHSSFQG